MKKKLVFKNEIYIKHKQLINNLKKKIKKYNKQEFFPHHDIPTYFSPFYNCSGLFSIQKILNLKTNFFSNIFYILKDFFYSFRYYELLKIFGDDQKIKKRNVVFTWGIKKNFLKNGSYYDKYLNINSRKDKNTAWVIIYLDEGIPKNFDKNIFIIQPKKKNKIEYYFIF